jgi:hypothetical protein
LKTNQDSTFFEKRLLVVVVLISLPACVKVSFLFDFARQRASTVPNPIFSASIVEAV